MVKKRRSSWLKKLEISLMLSYHFHIYYQSSFFPLLHVALAFHSRLKIHTDWVEGGQIWPDKSAREKYSIYDRLVFLPFHHIIALFLVLPHDQPFIKKAIGKDAQINCHSLCILCFSGAQILLCQKMHRCIYYVSKVFLRQVFNIFVRFLSFVIHLHVYISPAYDGQTTPTPRRLEEV